ncbi:MAG TPA: PLD nuclease N-terminal domain-containing protein [Marmoricola sp.]|nr:PLD nuclease N-terminal domain-containing protein [Marmoricola sp.]
MIRFDEGLFMLTLALEVYCVIEVIMTREDDVRHLPKIAWLLLVLFFPLIGSIAWLAAGRPQRGPAPTSPYERSAASFPEYDRPGRAAGLTAESDEAFLSRIRERAEEQRRVAAEQKKAAAAAEAEAEGPAPEQEN